MATIETCLSPDLLPLHEVAAKNVVIVDIFRATSTMVAALANGVSSILPIMDLESCRAKASEGYVIAGERNGKTASGFELGNSPLAYTNGQYAGKRIAMTTTNGTVAIEKTASFANQIVLGAFINLESTANYLLEQKEDVLIVCAGWKGKFNLEDSLYAGALAKLLVPRMHTDCDATIAMRSLYESNEHRLKLFLSQAAHSKRLQNHGIEEDIDFCLTLNQYSVVGVVKGGELVVNSEN
ncbi:2-phosphosulfolactate phosphatase [Mongoliitalea daihaiensis]|uniref:2-phosphosulfolactate phosphatase n=1 Tax=Mongoliitalea daihaiensis TaxID=2782006 RepID=UPI001F354201|nr:2-phosphosulfolactate phosphatase [Mongoliitalea daihaiensis]UJP63370.1 2-phosphosulfolactate phosphatase [Mongoliitalea daihaiensis]